MRIRFNGPEGSKYVGLELRFITISKAPMRVLEAVQLATGLPINTVSRQMVGTVPPDAPAGFQADDADVVLSNRMAAFLTLRNAGFPITWDESGDFCQADLEAIPDPGDPAAEPADEADPTSARTGSVPGVEDDTTPPATPSPRRSSRSASKTPSAPVS